MTSRALSLLLALTLAGAAAADAPARSLRPVARGQVVGGQVLPAHALAAEMASQAVVSGAAPSAPAASAFAATSLRPPSQVPERATVDVDPMPVAPSQPTPEAPVSPSGPAAGASTVATAITPRDLGVTPQVAPRNRSLLALMRPRSRGPNAESNAKRVESTKRKSMICGDPDIQGLAVGRVAGTIKGCGLEDAVRVRSVVGVGLSTHAVMDCTTARMLKAWVMNGVQPAIGSKGGGVAELRVAAHYACRTRNNQSGAKLSEHGKGRAIDIAGFRLRDGTVVTVLEHWGDRTWGKPLRAMWRAACGPFGTVLGPAADRFHRDHFHFDTAAYRSGSYCR